ncbi:MAG: endolytic transglycosylase MltG [Gammaproteobacteria bacterium]
MRKQAGLILAFIIVIAGVAFATYRWATNEFTASGPTQQPVRMEVPAGASVRGVVRLLGERGILDDPRAVALYLRTHDLHPKIKAGTYDFPAGASPARIFQMLEQGQVVLEQLTVVEGSTFSELRKSLEKHPAVTNTLKGKTDAQVMTAIGHANEFPEGRFFPDTYRFAARTTDTDILKLAYDSMARTLAQAWEQKKEGLPVTTPYEALTLASIVEKETGLASERPRIAGVFTTRLRTGMRLQSDPTVIYGIGPKYDGDIRTKDLSTDTPYNTYTRGGLPPTPIALPGRESIMAVVRPDETGDIFFVAVGDGTGAHHFSKTLEEHNEAVRQFLVRLRQQSQSPRTQSK